MSNCRFYFLDGRAVWTQAFAFTVPEPVSTALLMRSLKARAEARSEEDYR